MSAPTTQTAAGRVRSDRPGAEARVGRHGLVHLKQVERSLSEPLEIDTSETRIRRLQRATLTSARLLQMAFAASGFRYQVAMLTLTYADPSGWSPRDISGCMRLIRQWAKRRRVKIANVWVCEVQGERLKKYGDAVPHYHVLLWLPVGVQLPFADSVGWWPHGFTKIEYARNAVGYIAKYASKGDLPAGAVFPPGLRLHGAGGLPEAVSLAKRWWLLPSYLRSCSDAGHDFRRAPGGGFVAKGTNTFVPSPFALRSVGSKVVKLIQVRPFPPPLCPSGWIDSLRLCEAPNAS